MNFKSECFSWILGESKREFRSLPEKEKSSLPVSLT